ncbi:hypothetical protein A3B05_02850 [Candidatus Giovannonibacteria bacterium RIFCSPLOWO2_01_FULL_43_160]|uniref:Uncharacterized protein n=1 Tax=Candidatus Giovannonibacteria bacterium RIFCSPLOWO2_12_FULL_43_26 TaxID=1798363 RepID=A0A1F5XW99_9BACT|nr:MAG: hypothetical protein A2652_01185 [Candidatus Giovannonibacteria bacterium RIFCSPHIGHO2_01_FULL_43_140]OGF69664.1 MAG: hypothetical protein A3C76_01810 [Candidatus Giovannonibacteria bacterium RIFCSPHIGHO2_02_FULL_44_51]OGF71159.1 MAG: hypothetical protein A3E35_02280 [Candidatus Giovannonibacteria bacterium RIFCSPHIGHO2_12_FULL_44_22]OGF74862.1 MAG: hypothetical protein A3B05_02850 [Candidatus Giovannonibacteria bacterium RIFCSPLOWO2_01_FULL_43_160]OGF86024.1 MAG: hypothetical protein A
MRKPKQGFIQIIIIAVLLVIILSLLGVSLNSLFSNSVLRDNFGFLGRWLGQLWDNYFSAIFNYFWNIWINLFWQPFLDTMKGLQNSINPFNSK